MVPRKTRKQWSKERGLAVESGPVAGMRVFGSEMKVRAGESWESLGVELLVQSI